MMRVCQDFEGFLKCGSLLVFTHVCLGQKTVSKGYISSKFQISSTKSKTTGQCFLQTPLVKCPLSPQDLCQIPQISLE